MSRDSRVIRDAGWAEALGARLGDGPVATWMERHTRVLKRDNYSRVGLLELAGQACWLKLFIARSPVQQLAFRLGKGRAVRSFDAAVRLLRAGLPAPAPRACVRVPEGMLLLTEGIDRSADLRAIWRELHEPTEIASVLAEVGAVLAELHHAGFAHGDCKWSNVLYGGGRVYLVDLEDVRKLRCAGETAPSLPARQARDLARFMIDAEELGVSREQFDRFLGSYSSRTKRSPESLIEAVRSPAERIRRRHLARYGAAGKPLF